MPSRWFTPIIGKAGAERQSLCHVHSNDQRAGQTGTARDRDRIDILQREIRLRESLLDNGNDAQYMLARGYFREYAPIACMDIHLRRDRGR